MLKFTPIRTVSKPVVTCWSPTRTGPLPTIGVVAVTLPGAADCMNKISRASRHYFSSHEYPNLLIHQLNFSPTHHAQQVGRWDIVENRLMQSIDLLAKNAADFVIIPANTVHKVIASIDKRSPIPVISMLDVVASNCLRHNLKTVGVLGTRWTMADHLYREPFAKKGIKEVLPSREDQARIQEALFSELIPTGRASTKTVNSLLDIVKRMKDKGCDGIILACTELPLVLHHDNCELPAIDTTGVLADAAVKRAFEWTPAKKPGFAAKF